MACALPSFKCLRFYLPGHLKSTVYATEVSDIQDWIQHVFEMPRKMPGIFQPVRPSVFRRATTGVEAQGEIFGYYL
jgi:hypothetical protein